MGFRLARIMDIFGVPIIRIVVYWVSIGVPLLQTTTICGHSLPSSIWDPAT